MSWMLKNYSPFRKSVIRNHLCNKAPIEGYTNALFPEAEKSLEFFPA